MGVSAVIDPIGELRVKTPLGEKLVAYDRIYLNDNKTFYAEYGNAALYGYFGFAIIYLIIYLFITIRRKKS